MWELDHNESWALKNWCFWTVVLEKTLQNPLDCKETKPVNTKISQSWIFIGRTYAEAEAPILWPPDGKSWLIRKDPDAGEDWSQEEKVTIEDKMVGWHHKLNWHEFEQALGVGDGQGSLASCSPRGCKESDMTGQQHIVVWSSVQFSHSVVSDSLRPHGLQHTKPPRPSPTPGACSNSYPSSQWCHPTISSYVIPFSSCLQSFPESGSFPMSQFFTSGGQSIGASASALFLPVNIHDWFPLGLSVWSPFSPCILLAVWSKK